MVARVCIFVHFLQHLSNVCQHRWLSVNTKRWRLFPRLLPVPCSSTGLQYFVLNVYILPTSTICTTEFSEIPNDHSEHPRLPLIYFLFSGFGWPSLVFQDIFDEDLRPSLAESFRKECDGLLGAR